MYKYYCDLILDNIPFSSTYEDVIHFKNDNERNDFYNYISENNDKQINFNRANGKEATAVAYLNNYYFYKNRIRVENPTLSEALNVKYARVKEINDEINETKYYFYFVQNVEILNSNTIKLLLQIDIFTTYTGLFESFTNKVNIVRYCCDRYTADSVNPNLKVNWQAPYLEYAEPISFNLNQIKTYTDLTFGISDSSKEGANQDVVNRFASQTYYYYIVSKETNLYCFASAKSTDGIRTFVSKKVGDITTTTALNPDTIFKTIQSSNEYTLLSSYVSRVPVYFFVDCKIAYGKMSNGETAYQINLNDNATAEVLTGGLRFEIDYEGLNIDRKLARIDFEFQESDNEQFEPKVYANPQFTNTQIGFRGSTFDFSISQFKTNQFQFYWKSCLNSSSFIDTIYLNLNDNTKYGNLSVASQNGYSVDMLGDKFAEWQKSNKNWQKQFILNNAIQTFSGGSLTGIIGNAIGTIPGAINQYFQMDNLKNSPSSLISQGDNFNFDSITKDNQPKLILKTISEDSKKYLKEYFKRFGYSTNEYLNPSECFIRERFNYIQMNLESHTELPSIDIPRILEDDLFIIFNQGLRVWEIDSNVKNNNFNYTIVNVEKRLFN